MKLLDAYCGQGGAAMGYHRAGFTEIVGVDNKPQPRYPFTFVLGDALEYIAAHGHEFDVIHASPPCRDHTTLAALHGKSGSEWLLNATRDVLRSIGSPYVIENVVGAEQPNRLLLCGSHFGLGATCRDGAYRQLRRHRQFESNMMLFSPGACRHEGQPVGIYGNGGGGQMTRGYKAVKTEAEEALGIDWMTRAGLSQAIPPAMTEFIGQQLADQLRRAA